MAVRVLGIDGDNGRREEGGKREQAQDDNDRKRLNQNISTLESLVH